MTDRDPKVSVATFQTRTADTKILCSLTPNAKETGDSESIQRCVNLYQMYLPASKSVGRKKGRLQKKRLETVKEMPIRTTPRASVATNMLLTWLFYGTEASDFSTVSSVLKVTAFSSLLTFLPSRTSQSSALIMVPSTTPLT